MAGQRSTVEFTVEGQTITALTAGPAAARDGSQGKPLIAALHGGTYTARYYDVAGSAQGSFMDLAAAAGYPVVCFDRPGYGASPALPPPQNTVRQAADGRPVRGREHRPGPPGTASTTTSWATRCTCASSPSPRSASSGRASGPDRHPW
jgi:pimeloyl-ACP methyl ester carboxylesterase